MQSKIVMGFSDQSKVVDEIDKIFQTSDALTTPDVPMCGKGINDESHIDFKSLKDRKNMAGFIRPKLGSTDPAQIVHLKIRWKDKKLLERATDFFDYVAPIYAEPYKFKDVFYSASNTGMDVMYSSERPLWLAQLWVSWNMFLNQKNGTALR